MTLGEPLVTISRTASDGTDLGQWSVGTSKGQMACVAPDESERILRASSLLEAVAEMPDAFRLAPGVLHSVDCRDPGIHEADLAAKIRSVTPDLGQFLWQDVDNWEEGLFYEHVYTEELMGLSEWLAGDVPLTINGLRVLPVDVGDREVRLLPFEVADLFTAEPHFVEGLASVTASNEWGTYSAEMGILPRGFLCERHDSEDVTLSFERVTSASSSTLRQLAFDWVRGILGGFYFQVSPTVLLDENGALRIAWPDGYRPEDYDESVSAWLVSP